MSIFSNSHRYQASHLPLRWHNALLDAQSLRQLLESRLYFRLADVGVDVDITLDGGMKEEAGDYTVVP